MEKIDYKRIQDWELNDRLKDLELRMIQASSKFNHQIEKPENFSRLRREVARIKTELTSRKDGKR